MLSVVAGPIAWVRGARTINWLQDLFPEVATALGIGQTKTQKWALSLLRRLRDLTLQYAASNVVLGERMAARLKKRRVPQERITIIANWANGNQIRPVERTRNALRKEWNLKDAFVVGYSGNLGRAHNFETFLTAVAHLEEQQKARSKARIFANAGDSARQDDSDEGSLSRHEVRWLFIGSGNQTEKLQRAVQERGYDSVMFRPYQPRERLSDSLSAPDVHLISLKPNLEGLIVPSKYYGIAAAGRPAIFVGNPDGELAHIIKDSNTGFVVRDGDGVGLAEAILTLARNPQLPAEQGARARRLFETKYDFAHAVTAWERLIQKVSAEA
jgi:glycosyltransferase involved in cell wall biosynthesis